MFVGLCFNVGVWILGGELIDSCVYQDDSGFIFIISMVNIVDILQVYVSWQDVVDGVQIDIQLGWFMLNVGS